VRKTLNSDLEQLTKLYSARAKRLYAEIDGGIKRTSMWLTLLGAFTLMLAGIGAWVIGKSVVRPIETITSITEDVASGNAAVAIPFSARNDEIGALARSISVFQKAMRTNDELTQTMRADVETRLQRQERVSQEIARFSSEVESTIAELGRISDQMLEASTRLASVADDASLKTEQATGGVRRSVPQCARHRVRRGGTVRLGEGDDQQVAQSNDIAGEGGERGRTHQFSGEGIGRSRGPHRRRGEIDHRHRRADEPARAECDDRGRARGRSGTRLCRGRATEEIAAQIAGMQRATARSIEAIGAIEHIIREIGAITGAIAAAVTEQGQATAEIARSVDVAARHTAQTADGVNLVGTATDENRAGAGAVKAVSDDLCSVASRIRNQVDAFFVRLSA
jgi:methyl-accepting chemotaxis protein